MWTPIAKPVTTFTALGSPLGLLLSLTHATGAGTNWTKVAEASGTSWTGITKPTTSWTKIAKPTL